MNEHMRVRILKFVMLHSITGGEDSVVRLILGRFPADGSIPLKFGVQFETDAIVNKRLVKNAYAQYHDEEASARKHLSQLEKSLRTEKGFHSVGECSVCYSPEPKEDFSKGAVGGRQRRFSLDN